MKYIARLSLKPTPILCGGGYKFARHVGVPLNKSKPNLSVYLMQDAEKDTVRGLLPSTMRSSFIDVSVLTVMQAYPHVHVDAGVTAINWYLDTGGETTTFYEGTQVDISAERFADIGNGYTMPDPKLLTPVESYVANKGDVWMIDLLTPHSVSIDPTLVDIDERYAATATPRKIIHATFSIPFQQAVEVMKEYLYE